MSAILVIDDDPGITYVLSRTIEKMGHEAAVCHSLAEAESRMRDNVYDVVLLDVGLPDGNGLTGIERMAAHPSHPEIIVITGLGIAEDAAQAITNGAWDYIQKTASPRVIMHAVQQALHYRAQKKGNDTPVSEMHREGIIGESPQLAQCLESMLHIAKGESNVLIFGETGTGKEAFARAIHNNSPRRDKAFVIVDCGSLPDKLVESILFGHVRGAFTGADRDAAGLVREADGGTLFLDEVGELPSLVQSSFLRVLQQRTYRRVGSLQEERSNFRLVAATNRNLEDMAAQGLFRKDLLFRLRGAFLTLPPLHERTGDIPRIASHYITLYCHKLNLPLKEPSPEFLAFLDDYPWPGNARELVNTIEYAVNAAQNEEMLFQAHLPRELRARVLRRRVDSPVAETVDNSKAPTGEVGGGAFPPPPPGMLTPPAEVLGPLAAPEVVLPTQDTPPLPSAQAPLPPLAQYREQAQNLAEKKYIEQLMQRARNDMAKACAISGLSQSRLYALLKKHDVATPGWRKG